MYVSEHSKYCAVTVWSKRHGKEQEGGLKEKERVKRLISGLCLEDK